MRRSAIIVVMCAMLVAALLSPGLAMAKGGNGRHQVATPKASETGKSKAGAKAKKTKAKKAKAAKHPTRSAKAKASSSRTTAKNAEKPSREARKTEAAEKQQSTANEQPAGSRTPTKAPLGTPPSTGLANRRISADTTAQDGTETRGVLDTIRLKVNASIEGTRATAVGMWSAVTSWFGD